MTITIKEIYKVAKSSRYKVGDKVVFMPMCGVWSDLKFKTGTIIKINSDPIWKFDIEIDLPHLLKAPEEHLRANDFVTCVGPTAIVPIRKLTRKAIVKMNINNGLADTASPEMSKLVATRHVWQLILAMSETGKSIKKIKKMIVKCDRAIEKLRRSGVVELSR